MFPSDPVTEYAKAVVSGRLIAGPYVRATCQRHLNDLKRTDIYFDTAQVARVFRFFNKLRLSEGQFEGKPFQLHPSQEFIVGSIFGWKRQATGLRRFKRAYIEQGKGNGKTPLIAAIGLYGMVADDEPGAQIYSAAAKREQADIMFQDAVKMAQACSLKKRITFSGNAKVYNMAVLGAPQHGSFFRPVSKTVGKTGSGPRPHMALCDEVHEHPDGDTIQILERGFKWRRQPLLIMITNSGFDMQSKCREEHEFAVSVALGDIKNDSAFSYVCAVDEGEDPFDDENCWIKTNPLLGVTVTEEYLRDVVNQAKQIPGDENKIRRLHFCQWTDSEEAWISREAWEACEDETLNIEDFKGKTCYGGLDLSSTKDLSARALVFEDGFIEMDDGKILPKFALFAHGYTPKFTIKQRARKDRTPYDEWEKGGFITATPGKVIRFSYIIDDLHKDSEKYDLINIAYDRYLHPRFEEDMGDAGISLPLVEHPQGFSRRKDTLLWMPESIKAFETLILEHRIRISVNPCLRAACAGAKFITSPAELKRFDKQKATKRIDPLIAAVMAIGAATTRFSDEGGLSIYETLAQESNVNDERKPDDRLTTSDNDSFDEFFGY